MNRYFNYSVFQALVSSGLARFVLFAVAGNLSTLAPSVEGQVFYEFEQSSTGDILATIELTQLPADVDDITELTFTPSGEAFFGLGPVYSGAFDRPVSGFAISDDGAGGLGCGTSLCSANFIDDDPPVSTRFGMLDAFVLDIRDGPEDDLFSVEFPALPGLFQAVGDWRLAQPILYWSGASEGNNRDYSDPSNWVDARTGLTSSIAPDATTQVIWDDRIDPGAAIGEPPFFSNEVLIEFSDTQTHQAKSITITSESYAAASLFPFVFPDPPGPGTVEVSGPLTIQGSLLVEFGLTVDLRSGGEDGDVLIPSSAFTGGLSVIGGNLFADEVIVEGSAGETLQVANFASNLNARHLNLQNSSQSRLRDGAQAIVDEGVVLSGRLNVIRARLTAPLTEIGSSGSLVGNNGSQSNPLISGDVVNNGNVGPGDDTPFFPYRFRPGLFTINGDYTQQSNGQLEIDLNAITPASLEDPFQELSHDVLSVSGAVMLSGDLSVLLGPDINIEPGMEFVFLKSGGNLSGEFTGLSEGAIAFTDPLSGLNFAISYLAGDGNDVSLLVVSSLDGDYNNDGVVDATDYAVWRENLGSPAGTLFNDVDGGTIGVAQFETWAANFGARLQTGSLSVPEPLAVSLSFAAAVFMAGGLRRPDR